MKISIIGGGFMGEAILKGMITSEQFDNKDISVIEIDKDKRDNLLKYNIETFDNYSQIMNAQIILIAIKPQQIKDLLTKLKNEISESTLIISIAAGTSIKSIKNILKEQSVIRVMPNLLSEIGYGASVFTIGENVSKEEVDFTKKILNSFSKLVLQVDDEKSINAATAIHGSGPAYFFIFIESIINAAISIGIQHDDAKKLAVLTMIGSGYYIESSEMSLSDMQSAVASPGGTTEAALKILKENNWQQLIEKAIQEAFARANELSKE
jgi:pyrroline-5-carboxylate reductase